MWSQSLLSGPYWPFRSCTSQTGPLLLKDEAPPWLAEEERASCHGQAGWELGEASCNTGAVPSHFHFIYLLSLPPSLLPPSLLPPSIHPFFLSLPSSASGPALSPCWAPLCPVNCGRANGISLFLLSLPQIQRVKVQSHVCFHPVDIYNHYKLKPLRC